MLLQNVLCQHSSLHRINHQSHQLPNNRLNFINWVFRQYNTFLTRMTVYKQARLDQYFSVLLSPSKWTKYKYLVQFCWRSTFPLEGFLSSARYIQAIQKILISRNFFLSPKTQLFYFQGLNMQCIMWYFWKFFRKYIPKTMKSLLSLNCFSDLTQKNRKTKINEI